MPALLIAAVLIGALGGASSEITWEDGTSYYKEDESLDDFRFGSFDD